MYMPTLILLHLSWKESQSTRPSLRKLWRHFTRQHAMVASKLYKLLLKYGADPNIKKPSLQTQCKQLVKATMVSFDFWQTKMPNSAWRAWNIKQVSTRKELNLKHHSTSRLPLFLLCFSRHRFWRFHWFYLRIEITQNILFHHYWTLVINRPVFLCFNVVDIAPGLFITRPAFLWSRPPYSRPFRPLLFSSVRSWIIDLLLLLFGNVQRSQQRHGCINAIYIVNKTAFIHSAVDEFDLDVQRVTET